MNSLDDLNTCVSEIFGQAHLLAIKTSDIGHKTIDERAKQGEASTSDLMAGFRNAAQRAISSLRMDIAKEKKTASAETIRAIEIYQEIKTAFEERISSASAPQKKSSTKPAAKTPKR